MRQLGKEAGTLEDDGNAAQNLFRKATFQQRHVLLRAEKSDAVVLSLFITSRAKV